MSENEIVREIIVSARNTSDGKLKQLPDELRRFIIQRIIPGKRRGIRFKKTIVRAAGHFCTIKQFDIARDLLNTLLSVDKNNIFAMRGLAHVELDDEKPEEAEKHFQAVLGLCPEDALSHRFMAQIAFARGDKKTAEQWLLQGRERSPNDIIICVKLAALYKDQRRKKEAAAMQVVIDRLDQLKIEEKQKRAANRGAKKTESNSCPRLAKTMPTSANGYAEMSLAERMIYDHYIGNAYQ